MTVTASDVRYLIDTNLTDAGIDKLISVAQRFVDPCDGEWSADQTDDIVEQVVCHLIVTAKEPEVSQKKLGDASETYSRSQAGMGLRETSYGRTAIMLDDTGCLARRGRNFTNFKVL